MCLKMVLLITTKTQNKLKTYHANVFDLIVNVFILYLLSNWCKTSGKLTKNGFIKKDICYLLL